MNDWVVLNRKIIEWEWYADSHMVHLFIHLIMKANHADARWKGIMVKRGQLITGRKILSAQTGISEQSIRTCLDKLVSTKEIVRKATKYYSIITICNYDTYQFPVQNGNQQTNHQSTINQPTSNHQLTTNNKKEKEIEEIKEKAYPEEIFNFYNEILPFFPEKTRPKEVAQRKGWLDTILTLQGDGYTLIELKKIIQHYRKDSFWKKNFLTLDYLLGSNKHGIKRIDDFSIKLKDSVPNLNVDNEEMMKILDDPDRLNYSK